MSKSPSKTRIYADERQTKIKTCPTCGEKIQLVITDVIRKFKELTYTVPAVQFHACSNCIKKNISYRSDLVVTTSVVALDLALASV